MFSHKNLPSCLKKYIDNISKRKVFFSKIALVFCLLPFLSACVYHIDLGDNPKSFSWVRKVNGNNIEIETNLRGSIAFNNAETDIIEFPSNSDLYIELDGRQCK